jgi:hypothetical protein
LEECEHNPENGYHMGVYLCLGQPIHSVSINNAKNISEFTTFSDIHQYMCIHGKVLINLGKGLHKIKKKAEQISCEEALRALQTFE